MGLRRLKATSARVTYFPAMGVIEFTRTHVFGAESLRNRTIISRVERGDGFFLGQLSVITVGCGQDPEDATGVGVPTGRHAVLASNLD